MNFVREFRNLSKSQEKPGKFEITSLRMITFKNIKNKGQHKSSFFVFGLYHDTTTTTTTTTTNNNNNNNNDDKKYYIFQTIL